LPRYRVDWPVKLTGRRSLEETYFGEGVLQNIGAKGACLYTNGSLRVGERLDVSIKLPLKRENWLVYSAEVVRVEQTTAQARVALRFDYSKPGFSDR
jgi:hypothetical protein